MDGMSTRADTARSLLSADKPLSIAILAMGGQGGGVLGDWIVSLAEANGWYAQSTSVPGVAQRTGATIYYVELLKHQAGTRPTLSLMPAAGEVDVVIATEFMEAGRAMLRGLVTPDRATLIASTHWSYAVVAKAALGDGIADSAVVATAADVAAKRIIVFDMAALAEQAGSVISSALFGALAAAQALPFPRTAFEAAIRAGGKGVEASLRAFDAAFRQVERKQKASESGEAPAGSARARRTSELDHSLGRIRVEFPPLVHAMLFAGTKRLVDYQDPRYAHLYLDRLGELLALDNSGGGAMVGYALTREAARYLATANGVRRHDSGRRPKDPREPLPSRAQRGRSADRPDRLYDRVHALADRGNLRNSSGCAGGSDRAAPASVSDT